MLSPLLCVILASCQKTYGSSLRADVWILCCVSLIKLSGFVFFFDLFQHHASFVSVASQYSFKSGVAISLKLIFLLGDYYFFFSSFFFAFLLISNQNHLCIYVNFRMFSFCFCDEIMGILTGITMNQ